MSRSKASTGVAIEAGTESAQRTPSWFGEAVLFGKYWLDSGLVGYLEEAVRVVRGRMGQYEVMDFVLLLLSDAISGERTLAAFDQALAPVKAVLMMSSLKLFFFLSQIIFPIQKTKTIAVLEFEGRVVQLKCELECVSN